jgi:hypothetical protein
MFPYAGAGGRFMAGRDAGGAGFPVFVTQKREAKKWQGGHFLAAQGIEAEIPEARRRRAEELERIARFFAAAKNAPE